VRSDFSPMSDSLPVACCPSEQDFFSPTLFSFALYRFTLLCSGKATMLIMTGRAMLTFSHTLSFAFLHSTGSPGTMLVKGDDNEYGKGKSNKGKGMDYSEQLFLTHSFCPSTGSQCHACWVVLGRVRSGQVEWGPVRSSRVKSGPVRLGHQVMGSGCWVRSG
jgi:hypothetical protein